MVILVFKWLLFLPGLPFLSSSAGNRANLAPDHPFYASVTEINHNAKEQTLEISCKLFTDDFEKILEKINKTPVDLYNPKNKDQLEQFIFNYLSGHLMLKLDGKPVKLQYLGHEIEDQSTWCYFQVNNIPQVHKLEITNSIFYETYDTQINIMHVSVAGNRKSTKLDYPANAAVFDF